MTASATKEQSVKRTIKGRVVSTKMAKTIVVQVDTYKMHPKYKKRVKNSKKFYAHDDASTAQLGDQVIIEESRPLSKLKRWTLKEVVAAK